MTCSWHVQYLYMNFLWLVNDLLFAHDLFQLHDQLDEILMNYLNYYNYFNYFIQIISWKRMKELYSSYEQVMKKSWTSHQQILNKLWTSQDLFMTCSLFVHELFVTCSCSQLLHYLFILVHLSTTSSQFVAKLSPSPNSS